MRIRGVGVDILRFDRFKTITNFAEDIGIHRIFTNSEMNDSQRHVNQGKYFSSRFAVKEAVLKSLRIDLNLVKYTDVEVYSNEEHQPCVRLLGDIKAHHQLQSIEQIEISLSYEDNYVIAYAITTTKEEVS